MTRNPDMMAYPDRIRVEQDAEGFWTCREAVSGSQEYVRADIVKAALTECAEARMPGEARRIARLALSRLVEVSNG